MTKTIPFNRAVRFNGRNGEFVAVGVQLEFGPENITIAPLTSKGHRGHCRIEITNEAALLVGKAIAKLE